MSRCRPLALVLTICGLLTFAPAALADNITTDADQSDVTATVGAEISISVVDPELLTLSHFGPASSAAQVSVVSTQPGWTVSIKDLDATSPGQLDRTSGSGPATLSDTLAVTPFGAQVFNLTGSNQQVFAGAANDETDVNFSQTLASGEDVLSGDTYASTVEYSVVAGEQGNGGALPQSQPNLLVALTDTTTWNMDIISLPTDGSEGTTLASYPDSAGYYFYDNLPAPVAVSGRTWVLQNGNDTSNYMLRWRDPSGTTHTLNETTDLGCGTHPGYSGTTRSEVSPDASEIHFFCSGTDPAYTATPVGHGLNRCITINATTEAFSYTTPCPALNSQSGEWAGSPDGVFSYSWVVQGAFLSYDGTKRTSEQNGNSSNIAVVPYDAGLSTINSSAQIFTAPANRVPAGWPTWLHDGSAVGRAYCPATGTGAARLYIFPLDNSTPSSVTMGGSTCQNGNPQGSSIVPIFSADGQWAAYTGADGSLYLLPTDGSAPAAKLAAPAGTYYNALAWPGTGETFSGFYSPPSP